MSRNVLALAIDAGGTMTDTFVVDAQGNFVIGKARTTPWDESVGFMESSQDALHAWDLRDEEAFRQFEVTIYSGTTMLNTLLQRKGHKVGLIVTKGMEDILLMEQGRQVWSGYSYSDRLHAVTHVHNEPLVPKRRVRGVTERVDLFGKIVIPLYEEDAKKAVEELLEQDIDSIVICFIYSHVNPVHEQIVEGICKNIMKQKNIDLPVFTSSRVRPVIRENQRINATVIEAYAADPVRKQLYNVENRAREKGYRHQLTTMLSYGGLANIRHPRLHETLVSGPIGGMLGAKYIASILGLESVLATDMGGTSYDFGLITRGNVTLNNEPELARFRMNLPSIELDSTSGGAGSYLSVDPITKRIQMGPESAGGDPGPVCFDKGNMIPTVTDCLAVNGYLNPHYFLGGKVTLNIEKAYKQLKEHVADPIGIDVHEAADGIIKIWIQNAREATRRAIQSRGYDVADYVIMGYGGAGPLVLAGVTEGLPFKGVLTFPFAAAFSAFGCTTTDYSHRYTKSCMLSLPYQADAAVKIQVAQALTELWDELQREAEISFSDEGMDTSLIQYSRIAYVRYGGQLDDVEVVVKPDWQAKPEAVDALVADFEEVYSRIYARAAKYPKAGYSIMQVALVASIPTVKPEFPTYPLTSPEPVASAFKGTRKVYRDGKWHEAKLYEMDALQPGNVVDGLAIIEHPATTLIVPATRKVRMDERRFLWLENK